MDEPLNDGGTQARERLPIQFQRKPRIDKLLSALILEAQEMSAALYTLYSRRLLSAAQGGVLDVYGRLVGEPRAGRPDNTYRIRIQARMTLNRSNGTPNELLQLARLLVPQPLKLRLFEYPPAAVLLEVGDGPTLLPDDVFAMLKEAKPAGVKLYLGTQEVPDDELFTFEGGGGLGWGDVNGDDAPPTIGPVTTPVNQNGFAPPLPTLPGPVTRPFKVYVKILETSAGVFSFSYLFAGDIPSEERLAPMRDGSGAYNPVPLLNADGSATGITLEWQEGEPYVNDDEVRFDVLYRPVGGRWASVRG